MKVRKVEYDLIRILAIILVIYNHTGTRGYFFFADFFDPSTSSAISWRYWIYMIPSIISKIAVPMFFMVSGALLLGKDESLLTIWKKRIARYLVILILASMYYYIIQTVTRSWRVSFVHFFHLVWSEGVTIPLWFLYAYISFLMLLPFLRKAAVYMSGNEFVYLAILAVVFQGILPICQWILSGGEVSIHSSLSVRPALETTVLYPLLGYGLSRHELKDKYVIYLGLAALASLIPVTGLTYLRMRVTGVCSYDKEELVCSFWNCFNVIRVTAVFSGIWLFVKRKGCSDRIGYIITETGTCVFGIYLVEKTVRRIADICMNGVCMNDASYLMAWIKVFFAFVISLSIIYMLRKMSFFRKLL